jgi:hypothetical protein
MMIVFDTFHVMRHHLTLKLITIFQLSLMTFRPRLCSPRSCFTGFITINCGCDVNVWLFWTPPSYTLATAVTLSHFKLLWGRKCFVLSGYGTSTTHIITLPFGLNPFGIKFMYLFSLEPIVFFETFFAVRTLFPFVQGSVRLFHTSNFNWEGSVLGFPLGFSFRKRMYFFPDGYSLGPCHY